MKLQIDNIREFQDKIAETLEGKLVDRSIDYGIRQKGVALRKRLLQEEVEELEEAMDNGDIVEVLDAGVDILYIVLGTMHEYDLLDKFGEAWNLIHANNMSKLGKDGRVLRNEFGKVIKPSNYKPVDLNILF